MMQVIRYEIYYENDVRTDDLPEGNLIGTSSFWYNEKTKKGIFSMTMVSNGLTCMMSYGINFKFDQDMMLNIINEEMK